MKNLLYNKSLLGLIVLSLFVNNADAQLNSCNGSTSDAWTNIGPDNMGTLACKGLINAIYVSPTDPDYILAGSISGGLWRSYNGGQTWNNITNGFTKGPLGIKQIEVAYPNTPNEVIYIASGTDILGELFSSNCFGVIKTTNSYNNNSPTWLNTNLTFNNPLNIYDKGTGQFLSELIMDIAIDPNSPNVIYAVSQKHAYRSDDGLNTVYELTSSLSLNSNYRFKDIEFQKGSSLNAYQETNVLYIAGGSQIWKTMDAGQSWNDIAPTSSTSNCIINADYISVASNKDRLYCFNNACQNVIYKDNGVANWVIQPNSSVLPGTHKIVVSPTEKNVVYTCCVRATTPSCERSIDGGNTFIPMNDGPTHPDGRCLFMFSGSTVGANGANDVVFFGHDGGISKKKSSDPKAWTSINGSGMINNLLWGFGATEQLDKMVIATQDDGFLDYNSGYFGYVGSTDAYDVVFDKNNSNNIFGTWTGGGYSSSLYGAGSTINFAKSTSGSFSNNIGGGSEPEHSYKYNPDIFLSSNNQLYYAGHDLWSRASVNGGWVNGTWINESNISAHKWNNNTQYQNGLVSTFAISTNNQTKYIAYEEFEWGNITPQYKFWINDPTYYPTTTDLTSVLNSAYSQFGGGNIKSITVNPSNPYDLFILFRKEGVFGTKGQIFRMTMSLSGGSPSWQVTDVTKNLPYLAGDGADITMAPTKLIWLNGSKETVFLATHVGVFMHKASNPGSEYWVCYNNGFPPAVITDLEVNYRTKKLRAATYGRGIWEVSLPCAPEAETVTHKINSISYPMIVNGTLEITAANTQISQNIYVADGGRIEVKSGASVVLSNNAQITGCNGALGTKGNVIVQGGATLELKTGSKIQLYNTGYLKTGDQSGTITRSNVILNPNSAIELNGDNTYIELSGNLTLANNTAFKLEKAAGQNAGYVRFFCLSAHYTTPNIICGTNCTMDLTGSSQNDLIMDVEQESVYFPNNLQMLTLYNGKVTMNHSASRVSVPCSTSIKYINFDGVTKVSQRGLEIYGQAGVTISNCTFKNMQTGLRGSLIYGGSAVSVSNSTFTNNSTGAYINAKGCTFQACTFTNNTTGLNLNNLDFNSAVNTSTFDGQLSHGLVVSSANASLNLTKTIIKNSAHNGINANNTMLNLNCGEIVNNHYNGIELFNNAGLTASSLTNTGHVKISENEAYPVHLVNSGSINIDEGYNYLVSTDVTGCSPTNMSACTPAMQGSMVIYNCVSSANYNFAADHNTWFKNGSGAGQSKPGNSLIDITTNCSGHVYLPDASVSAISTCPLDDPNNGHGNPPQQRITNNCNNCQSITTNRMGRKQMHLTIKDALALMDTTKPNGFSEAAGFFADIVKQIVTLQNLSDKEARLLRFAENQLGDATGRAISLQQASLTDLVQAVSSYYYDRSVKEATNEDIKSAFYDRVNAALVYKAIDNRSYALELLLEAKNLIYTGMRINMVYERENVYVDYLLCSTLMEDNLYKGIIPKEEYLDKSINCEQEYQNGMDYIVQREGSEHGAGGVGNTGGSLESLEEMIQVIPNPAKETINVNYTALTEDMVFELYDITGVQKTSETLVSGTSSKQVDISSTNIITGPHIYRIKKQNTIVKEEQILIQK